MSTMRVHVHAYLQIENPVLGPVVRRFGPLVRGAFESKLTAGYRVGPELAEMAFLERERLLERVREIEGLAPLQLAQFEELVRAQAPASQLAGLTLHTTRARFRTGSVGEGGARTAVAPITLPRLSRATPR